MRWFRRSEDADVDAASRWALRTGRGVVSMPGIPPPVGTPWTDEEIAAGHLLPPPPLLPLPALWVIEYSPDGRKWDGTGYGEMVESRAREMCSILNAIQPNLIYRVREAEHP